MNAQVNGQGFRKFPKNTWRLTRLQQRYIKIRFQEEHEVDGHLVHSESDQELRKHLISNFDYITSTLNTTSISNIGLRTAISTNTTRPLVNLNEKLDYAKSVSSIPSLTSEYTSSPSLSLHSNYIVDSNNHHSPQLVPENKERSVKV